MTEYMEFAAPPVCESEVLRYAGARVPDGATLSLMRSVIDEAAGQISYKVCFSKYDIVRTGETLDLGFAKSSSRNLAYTLRDSSGIVLFAATIGLGIDRLISRYSRTSPSRALFMQAFGAERIEALCDAFENTLPIGHTTRYSPGYGDLPIEIQRQIFASLDCTRKIGLTLNGSLLMTPTKSVTAIIGV